MTNTFPARARLPVLLLVVAFLAGGSARATTSSELRCASAIGTVGRQLLSGTGTILAGCERAVARGRLPDGTDCATEAKAARRRSALVAASGRRLVAACADADVVALEPTGACRGVATAVELAACLAESQGSEAEALIAIGDATRGPLGAAAARCAAEASKQIRGVALQRLQLLQACKRSRRVREVAPGAECDSLPDVADRLARQRVHAVARVVDACGAGALAATPFGAPCNRESTAADLGECLVSAARTVGDRALLTVHHDPGFCGDNGAAIEARIDRLLAQMTLAEKIEQMHGVRFPGLSYTAPNPRLGLPGIVMVDGPRGVGDLGQNTAFPVGMARGATWDPELETRVGEVVGVQARARGASMILAPTINMLRHPRWGRTQETYGEDTTHIGAMATAYVRGAQRHIIANPKHFAGNSIEDTRFLVDVQMDQRTLREVYLPHFRRAVQDGRAASVMSAYNKLNGAYCGENVHLLHDVLKGDWGFRGFVESDWIFGTPSTVPAVTAGLDIEMPVASFYGQRLLDAVTGGQVSEAVIDEAVRRILRAQLCFRLDTEPPQLDPAQVDTPAHRALARTVAEEAIVLLKNAGGALPLDRSAVHSIVVVGSLAATANLGDLGSSNVVPPSAVSPLAGIQSAAGAVTVTYVASDALSPGDAAVVAAADAAVVVAGLDSRDEGEGLITIGDRSSLDMPRNQNELITEVAAANPRTIVVLEGSGPVTMPWLGDVAGVLMAWYPGEEGGNAIASVLFGDVTPSGKLPLSFPQAESDLPPFDNVSLTVTYDYFHGYRHLDRNGEVPLFPFGFGLSYTTFRYANLRIDRSDLSPWSRLRVTADVMNTGAVAGDEVAQLYVGYQGSSVVRSVNDLKAFSRVHLEPGETRSVVFEVPMIDLAFWDTATSQWVVEPITYAVRVGSSSRDLPLEGAVTIAP